ncbi:MAG: M3 family metallopeptidase [Planctomycetota bacterium]
MEQAFARNITFDDSLALFTADELRGLSTEGAEGIERSGTLFMIPVHSPFVGSIARFCEVPSTRQKVELHYSRRGGRANVELIHQLVALRHELATLLGYPTAAHYRLDGSVAQAPEQVEAFYSELAPRVAEKAAEDIAAYEAAERAHTGLATATFQPWDRAFYHQRLLRREFEVDSVEVAKYFPLPAVRDGLFEIASELFGIRFEEVGATDPRARTRWHPDVQLFDVFDAVDDRLLGSVYLDVVLRAGKVPGAAQIQIRSRKRFADGEVLTPVVVLVSSFSKPVDAQPSLLAHHEVATLFHEFGHCLHSVLTDSELALFAGTNVARDFQEAPSQLLENWAWDPEVLGRFARHYGTGEAAPAELLERLVAARHLGLGYEMQRQLYLGQLDLALHSDPDGVVDVDEVARRVYEDVCSAPWTEGSLSHASFRHLGNRRGGYYGYLWSLVYAQDMFTLFEARGLLDPELGRRYRTRVLAPGGTRDALDLVTDFLGREPNGEAFARHLGL